MTDKHMDSSYICVHEEQIQNQSRKIEKLEARSDFKDQRLDELNKKIENMDDKLDKVLEGFNDLKIHSNEHDTNLELRIKAIETKLELQDKEIQNKYQYNQLIMAVITIIFIVLTFYFQFLRPV